MVLFDRASSLRFGTAKIVEEFEQGKIIATEVGGRRIVIGGLFHIGTSFAADGNFITSDLNFGRLFTHRDPGHIEVGIIALDPNTDIEVVKAYLLTNLPDDVRVMTKQEFVHEEGTGAW